MTDAPNTQQLRENWTMLSDIAEGIAYEALKQTCVALTPQLYSDLARFIQNCQAKDTNAWKRWTPGDIEELHRLIANYAPLEEISTHLGRSGNALELKWYATWDTNRWENPDNLNQPG